MDFYLVNMVRNLLNLTLFTEAEPMSILSNSVNITSNLLRKMSIIVLLVIRSVSDVLRAHNRFVTFV